MKVLKFNSCGCYFIIKVEVICLVSSQKDYICSFKSIIIKEDNIVMMIIILQGNSVIIREKVNNIILLLI